MLILVDKVLCKICAIKSARNLSEIIYVGRRIRVVSHRFHTDLIAQIFHRKFIRLDAEFCEFQVLACKYVAIELLVWKS